MIVLDEIMLIEGKRNMRALEILGGNSMGRRFSIYVPSKDKEGRAIDHMRWMKETMLFLTKTFGRCTAMPQLEGTWSDPASGSVLNETTNIVFSYVKDNDFDRHAQEVHKFLLTMGQDALQAEIGYEYDGVFYTIPLREEAS